MDRRIRTRGSRIWRIARAAIAWSVAAPALAADAELTPEQLQRLRTYQTAVLSVETPDVPPNVPVELRAAREDHSWAVYRGGLRLQVAEYYDAIGDTAAAAELRGDLDRYGRTARAWSTVGGVGAVIATVGAVGMATAATRSTYQVGGALITGGAAVGVLGFGLAAGPRHRATRDGLMYGHQLSKVEVADRVDVTNEALRVRLGVPPSLAWDLEP